MDVDRRQTLRFAALGVFAFTVAGKTVMLTPREARAADVPFRTLRPAEVTALDALGDTLLPGAADAGIAHFVDQQISGEATDCLLTIRVLDAPPPYAEFYKRGLASLDAACGAKHGKPFAELEDAARQDIVRAMLTNALAGWTGIPSPRFYFAARSDAVDVVYGTVEGFEKLGIPYMPHIAPTRRW